MSPLLLVPLVERLAVLQVVLAFFVIKAPRNQALMLAGWALWTLGVVFAILPIFVALERIDRSLLEAAEDLGDGPVRRFLRVTLPLAMPGVLASTLIVFIPTVGDFVTPRLVGGPNGVMIANLIQVYFSKANNAPLATALAVSSKHSL